MPGRARRRAVSRTTSETLRLEFRAGPPRRAAPSFQITAVSARPDADDSDEPDESLDTSRGTETPSLSECAPARGRYTRGRWLCQDFRDGERPQASADPSRGMAQQLERSLKERPEGSTPNNNNIDTRIEEAIDLVKSHVLLAVNQEVDYLREHVRCLEERIKDLEIENSHLRITSRLYQS